MATSSKTDDTLKSLVQQLATQRRLTHRRKEARESFRQEAMASWAAYEEGGRHVTGEEVRTWLNTWGTDGEKPAPECHE